MWAIYQTWPAGITTAPGTQPVQLPSRSYRNCRSLQHLLRASSDATPSRACSQEPQYQQVYEMPQHHVSVLFESRFFFSSFYKDGSVVLIFSTHRTFTARKGIKSKPSRTLDTYIVDYSRDPGRHSSLPCVWLTILFNYTTRDTLDTYIPRKKNKDSPGVSKRFVVHADLGVEVLDQDHPPGEPASVQHLRGRLRFGGWADGDVL